MAQAPHLRAGAWAEEQALRHLEHHGLRLLTRNFRCRLGEIDLIMKESDVLVFVEVRYRRDPRFGTGFESVTGAKQRKLLSAARLYLARYPEPDAPCRFDVISVTRRNYQPDILWMKDAFGQD